jgi:hypothetical protein
MQGGIHRYHRDVKQKLMEIEFNVPQKERAFAKLKVIKAFPVEGEKYKKRVIALYESRTRQKVKRFCISSYVRKR